MSQENVVSRVLWWLIAVLLLSACSRGLDGTYADEVGFMSFTFTRDGTVVQSTLGLEVKMTYEVIDERVVVTTGVGELELTRVDDQTLEGPFGMRLIRAE